jgi:hypothetical protein
MFGEHAKLVQRVDTNFVVDKYSKTHAFVALLKRLDELSTEKTKSKSIVIDDHVVDELHTCKTVVASIEASHMEKETDANALAVRSRWVKTDLHVPEALEKMLGDGEDYSLIIAHPNDLVVDPTEADFATISLRFPTPPEIVSLVSTCIGKSTAPVVTLVLFGPFRELDLCERALEEMRPFEGGVKHVWVHQDDLHKNSTGFDHVYIAHFINPSVAGGSHLLNEMTKQQKGRWGAAWMLFPSVLSYSPELVDGELPVGLLSYLIRQYAAPGDTVIDLYAGSGSAAIAANSQGRNCISFEIDEDTLIILAARLRAYSTRQQVSLKT